LGLERGSDELACFLAVSTGETWQAVGSPISCPVSAFFGYSCAKKIKTILAVLNESVNSYLTYAFK